MKKLDFITDKRKEIECMIICLGKNQSVIKRRGGTTTQNLGDEIRFQQKRVGVLNWAETATETEIQAEIARITNELPEELREPLPLVSKLLPGDIYESYCMRDLLTLCIGGE